MHKQLIDLRKAKTRVMMLNDLTTYYGRGETSTKEFLNLLLKQKEYRHLTNRIIKRDRIIIKTTKKFIYLYLDKI